MAETKKAGSDLQAVPDTGQTSAELATAAVYHDGVILLDIGAKGGEGGEAPSLKLAKDGHTVLVPQPTDDPNDPLNLSETKKNLILLVISISAFMGDFQAGAAIPCLIPQAAEWHLTPTHVNYANNLGVLMVGIGGVFWIPFIYSWGRAPVLFWTVFAGTLFFLGSALTKSFEGYYGLRTITGFTVTAGQTIGLAFIQDMFFFHQHAKKIGIWTAFFLASPYYGPLFGNFIISGTGNWRNVYWMQFGLGCLELVLIVLLADETWYRRDIPQDQQPAKGSRLLRLLGIWQIRNHDQYFLTFYASCRRMLVVLFKPIIFPILIYYLVTFMWAVGINQTSSILFATPVGEGGYGFSQKSVGYLFFIPIVAVLLGELFGHFANDTLANRYIRAHAGTFKPEARLPPIYFATFFAVPGLVIIGQALQRHLSWVAIVFGWGMYVFGYMIESVAITAYALDSYPTGSGEVSSLINFARLIGGFSVGYFQLAWGLKSGWDVSFGIQAALVGAVVIFIIPVLHIYGPRMRARGGPLQV